MTLYYAGVSKSESKTAKFWLEVFALIGLAAYTGVALLQWSATNKVMRLDQRPWMSPQAAGPLLLQAGQRIALPLYFQNIGKTAAFKIDAKVRMEVVKEGEMPTFDLTRADVADVNSPVLWQNEATPFENLLIAQSPTQALIFDPYLSHQYFDRKVEFVAFGRITYDEMWGIGHMTTFCKSVRAEDPSGIIFTSAVGQRCTAYTSVDKNY